MHTLCGDFITTATFDGSPLSLTSVPMSYDDATGTFSIYSEDEGLVGLKTVTIDSQLIEYPTNQNQLVFEILIVSACDDESTI